jgi:hypothetical protein
MIKMYYSFIPLIATGFFIPLIVTVLMINAFIRCWFGH